MTITSNTKVKIYSVNANTGEWVLTCSDTWLAICEANIEDASALAEVADALRKYGSALLDLGAGGFIGFAIGPNDER
jgi:hypothetical protein